jgi:hypothetical protein
MIIRTISILADSDFTIQMTQNKYPNVKLFLLGIWIDSKYNFLDGIVIKNVKLIKKNVFFLYL